MAIIINLETQRQARRRTQTQGMTAREDSPAVRNWIQSKELGALIREARYQRGWTNVEHLCANGVHLDPKSLLRIEQGVKSVEWDTIREIATVLQDGRITELALAQIARSLDCVTIPGREVLR